MGTSENGIYPPAKHFHWEDDENTIGIGGTLFSDKFTNIHIYSHVAFHESREHFGVIWGLPCSKLETGRQLLGATNLVPQPHNSDEIEANKEVIL